VTVTGRMAKVIVGFAQARAVEVWTLQIPRIHSSVTISNSGIDSMYRTLAGLSTRRCMPLISVREGGTQGRWKTIPRRWIGGAVRCRISHSVPTATSDRDLRTHVVYD